MKKLMLVIMVLLMFTLTGCMKEEDYYSRVEVNALLTADAALLDEANAKIDLLETALAETEDALAALDAKIILAEPTIAERYMDTMFLSMFTSEIYNFIEVGDTIEGTVEDWDYGYIVIELTEETTITITTTLVAPNGEWDLNIYYGSMFADYDIAFEEIYNGDTYTIVAPAGFVTFEIDSYSDNTLPFTITIEEGGTL